MDPALQAFMDAYNKKKARVDYYNQLKAAVKAGEPLDDADLKWLQQVDGPKVDLDVGPASVTPQQMDIEIGPVTATPQQPHDLASIQYPVSDRWAVEKAYHNVQSAERPAPPPRTFTDGTPYVPVSALDDGMSGPKRTHKYWGLVKAERAGDPLSAQDAAWLEKVRPYFEKRLAPQAPAPSPEWPAFGPQSGMDRTRTRNSLNWALGQGQALSYEDTAWLAASEPMTGPPREINPAATRMNDPYIAAFRATKRK